MKDYKQKLLEIESFFDKSEQRDWMSDIIAIQEFVDNNAFDMWLYIRAIYILHHILVEEKYPVRRSVCKNGKPLGVGSLPTSKLKANVHVCNKTQFCALYSLQ